LKIACVATGWYPQAPGGLEKYVFGMTKAAVRAGDAIDVFLTGDVTPPEPGARLISIARNEEPLWKRAIGARRAFATSFDPPYDVIDLHFAMNALPLIPFIDRRTPRVVHFHGPWAAEGRAERGNAIGVRVKELLERFVYRRADRFIVLSTAFKELLTGYGVDAERISVIPMGIDVDFFVPAHDRAAVRASLGWPADRTVFFTARRLVNRVGVRELIEAAGIVRATHENVAIKIAGKGPLREELQHAIRARGLDDCVELLGFVSEEDLVRSYQASDVTLLPTQALEGFGTIISESLACGTPVIVTPVGGMPEAVASLAPGLIARSASPTDIAERMHAVLERSLALPDHDTCRRYAVANYAWAHIYAEVRRVFTERIP
jgi:glycosyltransferase involved in cell wall biosynthesis